MTTVEPAIGAAETCAACGRTLEKPYACAACGALQPDPCADAFRFLDLPRAFDLDLEQVRAHYLEACRTLHPDRHGGSTEQLERSLRLTAHANQAWKTLSDLFQRAELLLELGGGKSAAEDKTVPQDVLAATLMLREELDDAHRSGSQTAVDTIGDSIKAELARYESRVAELGRQLPGDEQLRTQLRHTLNAAKYYQRMAEQL